MFGGSTRRIVCWMAVISATASSILTFGWKNTLMTPTPFIDWLSMCSKPSTVVVIARSAMVMTRFSMSSGEMPVYVQITLTTGMLMSGKMSVDIVS